MSRKSPPLAVAGILLLLPLAAALRARQLEGAQPAGPAQEAKAAGPAAAVKPAAPANEGQAAAAAPKEAMEEAPIGPDLRLGNIVIMVDDQDEALRFYTEKLGFKKKWDGRYGENKSQRWLTVSIPGVKGAEQEITLQKMDPEKRQLLQDYNRWILLTDDCQKTYDTLKARGVNVLQAPKERPWGSQIIFSDPFGNEFITICTKQKKADTGS